MGRRVFDLSTSLVLIAEMALLSLSPLVKTQPSEPSRMEQIHEFGELTEVILV